MTDRVLISSPLGMLSLRPGEISAAIATANEMVQALGLAPDPTPGPSTAETWLTVAQTSDLMNLPHCYLYEGLKSGTVPGRRFGRFWRIPESYTYRNELVTRGSADVST